MEIVKNMQEQTGNVNKEMGTLRKTQREVLEVSNTETTEPLMGSSADLRILRKSQWTWRKLNINFPISNAGRKKLKKKETTTKTTSHNYGTISNRGDTNITGLSEGGENETEGKSEVITAKNFPNWMTDTSSQIQKSQTMPSKRIIKPIPRHIIFKLSKVRQRENTEVRTQELQASHQKSRKQKRCELKPSECWKRKQNKTNAHW